MAKKRSEAEQQIAGLLQTARKSMRLSVAFLSRLDGTTQHLEVVESPIRSCSRRDISSSRT